MKRVCFTISSLLILGCNNLSEYTPHAGEKASSFGGIEYYPAIAQCEKAYGVRIGYRHTSVNGPHDEPCIFAEREYFDTDRVLVSDCNFSVKVSLASGFVTREYIVIPIDSLGSYWESRGHADHARHTWEEIGMPARKYNSTTIIY